MLARIIDSVSLIASWIFGARWRLKKDECFRVSTAMLDAGETLPVPKGALKVADRVIKPLTLAAAVGSVVGPRITEAKAEQAARKLQRARAATDQRFSVEFDPRVPQPPSPYPDAWERDRPPPTPEGLDVNREEPGPFDVAPASMEIPGSNGQTIRIPAPPAESR